MPRSTPLVAAALALVTALAVGTLNAPPASAGYDPARSTPQEDPYYQPGGATLDALHYRLRLHWAPGQRVLTGVARIRFRAPADQTRVQLDLSGALKVRKVLVDGRRAAHSHTGRRLVVSTGALEAGSQHILRISYRGTPRPASAPFTRDDVSKLGLRTTRRGELWTMQEPYGALTWYPVNDHPSDKAFYDVRISVPRGMVGIFNGRMTGRRSVGGRTVTRWHLASPTASYLTTLAVGDYVRYTDRGPRGLPISYWLPRVDRRALPELRRTPAMIRWLEKRLGPYPFDRIGAVVVPSGSAMETQTLVTMGSRMARDPSTFRSVLLHEYAHQWYGDVVSPDNWPDLWLNESFAMYLQLQWEISRGWYTNRELRAVLEEMDGALRRSEGPPGAYRPNRFAENCVYLCGALMLDRLRTLLGPTVFARVLRDWPQEQRFESVDRDDYIAWISAKTGRDLRPFLTTWLTSPTTPQ